MRRTWSQEQKLIQETLTTVIDKEQPVTLQLKKSGALRTKILKIHYYNEWPYLLILRPKGMDSSQNIQSFLFKMKGLPVLGFSCQIERESESILAVRLPSTLFQMELRENGRIGSLHGSMATFFMKNRARVNICALENISVGGVKLIGRPNHHMREKDRIGPCTLSLAGRDALISREVTVNNAHVARISEEEGLSGHFGLGIHLDLSETERGQLKEHIDYLGNH